MLASPPHSTWINTIPPGVWGRQRGRWLAQQQRTVRQSCTLWSGHHSGYCYNLAALITWSTCQPPLTTPSHKCQPEADLQLILADSLGNIPKMVMKKIIINDRTDHHVMIQPMAMQLFSCRTSGWCQLLCQLHTIGEHTTRHLRQKSWSRAGSWLAF